MQYFISIPMEMGINHFILCVYEKLYLNYVLQDKLVIRNFLNF